MRDLQTQLTVAIITFNEERRLRACLESVKWCPNLLVVDGHSTDGTVGIAREFTDQVYLSDLLGPDKPGGFAAQRNFTMNQARTDWVFFLDADERFTPELAAEITALLSAEISPETAAYRVRRKEHFFGVYTPYTHGESWLERMLRRDAVKWNTRLVHEGLEIEGQTASLGGYLLHFSKDSIADYLATQNKYTTLEAQQAAAEGAPLAASPLVPMLKAFLNTYIYKGSYREGAFGLIMSLLFAQYTFLTWSKRWEIEVQAGRIPATQPRQSVLEGIASLLAALWTRLSPPR